MLSSGGMLTVSAGASALSTTVASGAVASVTSGALWSGTTVLGGAREVVVDLVEPAPPLTGLPGVHDVTVEAGGLRQRLAFAPADTAAAAVIAAVAERVALRDVAVV